MRLHNRTRAIGVAVPLVLLGLVAGGSAAPTTLPQQSGIVDLLLQANVQLDGAAGREFTGFAVAGAGDVNGDGRADVLVGAPSADNNGRTDSGSAYVVFGKASTAPVDLAALGQAGFRIDGAAAGDAADVAGVAVAGAGDVNGDGRPDVLVGAQRADNNGRTNSGSAYVVYGFGLPRLAYEPLQATVGTDVGRHVPTLLERTGVPSFRVVPALPPGLIIDRLGVVTGTPNEPQPATSHMVTMTDLVGQVSASLRITVRPVPDTTAPRLVLGGSAFQRPLRQRGVIVSASCDEPCSLQASGRIAVLGTTIALPLRAASGQLARPGRKTLKLALSAAAQKRLAKLFAEGKRARATVTVRAVDGAGNRRSATGTFALRR